MSDRTPTRPLTEDPAERIQLLEQENQDLRAEVAAYRQAMEAARALLLETVEPY